MSRIICISILLFLFIFSYSQEPETVEIITSIAEELASDENNNEGTEMFIHQLYELAAEPVRINSGDEKEISRLFFLSDFQIKSLIDHINTSGNIVSVYEIATIPGFDRHTAEWMIQFISLDTKPDDITRKRRFSNSVLTNLIMKSGDPDSTYLGSPLKILIRYKFQTGRISGGLTAEKDPGETFLTDAFPLPDYCSAYIFFTGSGIVRKIILGDFGSRLGLGTNINTGMRSALLLNSPGYMSARNEIKPWTSTDENNFFRGTAAEFSFRNIGLILFLSRNTIDATTGFAEDSSESYVKSLYSSGLHNKPDLILKKDVLKNSTYGINLTYNFKSLRAGITWSYTSFSIPFRTEINDPEKLYDFTGLNSSIISFHYNHLINRLLFFGEISGSNRGNLAIIQGLTIRPSDRLSINLLYRNYSPGFISFHGKGPGNGSVSNNEKGILGNFSFELAKHFFIIAGCDISNVPWLKYRTSFPSMTKRYEVRLRYLPDEKCSFDLTYDFRSGMYDQKQEQGIASVSNSTGRIIKGVARVLLNERFTASARLDIKLAGPSASKGMLLLQDLSYRFRKIPLNIWFRYCIFRTDDWNSKLYTYENDLLYSFSIPALYGNGTRNYLMFKWDIKDFAEIRFKYGITEKYNNDSVPDADHEFKVQFRAWF